MLSEYIAVARVAKPQGIRGEVKLIPMTSVPDRFDGLGTVYLKDGTGYVPRKIRVTRLEENAVFAFLEGVGDRNAAEGLRDALLYVDRAHAVKPGGDSDFICDLIGLKARDSDGTDLGTLEDVMQPGGTDVYVIRKGRRELLVPALKTVVRGIDYGEGVIVFDSARLKEVSVTNED